MKRYLCAFAAAFAALAFWGCASSEGPDLTEGGKFGDRSTFAKGEIKLPANYNKSNFRKLLLGVMVSNVQIDPRSNKQVVSANPAQGLSTRLQTEMAKLKRFSVFSAFNRGGVTFFKSLEDVGDAKMPSEVNKRALDIVLTLNLMLTVERHERHSDDLLIYEVEVDANCEDLKTGEVKFAEKAKGKVERAVKISLSGRRSGGFRQDDARQAFQQAALQAIATIANKLGNYYPVGGRITGLLRDRMTLDKGFEHGVGKDMQMAVYTTVSGVDVPIAIAEASPADKTSNLKVWRWNDEDENAAEVLKELRADKKWIQKNECYAVGLRMAVPPEWDRDGKPEDRTR